MRFGGSTSEDGRLTVSVLEAGPPDNNLFLHVPAGFVRILFNSKYTWQFKTEPGPGSAGRPIPTTQGRTLGGSSSINGLNYTRGLPLDFDGWAQMGARGWSYDEVLPYFIKDERRISGGDAGYHGRQGKLAVTDCDWRHPLCDAFIEAAGDSQFPRTTITTAPHRRARDIISAKSTKAGGSVQQPHSCDPQ